MGEMASGIAHELNQPLGAISNYAETSIALLESGNVDPEQLRGDLEQIVRLTHRSSEIIRRLRSFIKKTEPRSESVVLQDVIDEVLQFVERDMRLEDVLIQYCWDVEPLTVTVDPVQIQQVLLNLLNNALDAVRHVPGPMRCVSIRATRTTPTHITVSISDTGPGMPPEVARRVFDPFFTTKPKGLGMGLAISHSIVRAHGGTLSVDPGPAGGTTFRFTLLAARS